jgi:GT2 family glycosyltransferase
MLLTMAVYDTDENTRSVMTLRTLQSLRETVDWARHRLIISDNGSCPDTFRVYEQFQDIITLILCNGVNLGTAAALNKAWKHRHADEAVCKVDNDVVWHLTGWADQIEAVFAKDHTIGVCGLKRRDLEEWPLNRHAFYVSTLEALPHEKGDPWLIVEIVNHVIGTCQAFRPEVLEKIGYLWQPGLYGFDDSLACARARIAGFRCAFLHGFPIDHIDPGGTAFITWKQTYAGETMAAYFKALNDYSTGTRPVYFDGGFAVEQQDTHKGE